MKSNKLCRMKKKIFLPMLVSLQLLFGSCENNFDPYIYGALLQGEYPSTEQEYVSYMMICYLPYTTVWTYGVLPVLNKSYLPVLSSLYISIAL